jgi:hypothetical protein
MGGPPLKFLRTNLFKDQRGVVMVEFAILIPFLLFITFGLLQLSLLFVADAVMEYAAFSAARAELVRGINTYGDPQRDVDPQKAAQMVCSLISFGAEDPNQRMVIPGWGGLPGSHYSQNHTQVQVDHSIPQEFKVTVTFDYELLFPNLALPFLSLNMIDFGEMTSNGQLILKKSCVMARSF